MSPQAINSGADRVNKDLVDSQGVVRRALEVDGPETGPVPQGS